MTMELDKLRENADRGSRLLKAMSNENRLMILCQLLKGERCVGDLEKLIKLGQSALSQHLARLRRENLVRTRRSAQTIYYSLNGNEAVTIISALYGLYCDDGTKCESSANRSVKHDVSPVLQDVPPHHLQHTDVNARQHRGDFA